MALTNKQKKQLNMRIDELVKGGVDDDQLELYRNAVGADDVYALAEVADYAARNVPIWQGQIDALDAKKAELNKKINLFN